MKSKILEKPEKIVGYVLLVVGLVVVIIPTYFGISRARATLANKNSDFRRIFLHQWQSPFFLGLF